jgi:hypothetical protein
VSTDHLVTVDDSKNVVLVDPTQERHLDRILLLRKSIGRESKSAIVMSYRVPVAILAGGDDRRVDPLGGRRDQKAFLHLSRTQNK